jgi:hypothetical protein
MKCSFKKTNVARHMTCKHTTSSITSWRAMVDHLFALYADRHEALYSDNDFRILAKLFSEREQ